MRRDSWPIVKLGDLAAPKRNALVGGPFGSNLVSADYVPNGIPVIRGQNMDLGRWVGGSFVFVSSEKARELSANLATPSDLVFTQRGTLGQVSIIPEGTFDKYLISQSQMKLSVDESKADVLFLYYLLSSRDQVEYVRLNAIQTGVPHTNLGILRSTPVRLPPLQEQKAISHVLGALDDKIESNRRISQTLEGMARAIFKSWFVDFEHFPGQWNHRRLEDLVTLQRDSLDPSLAPEEVFDHYSIPAFDAGAVPVTEAGENIRSNKLLVPRGAILISKLNPRIARVWRTNLSRNRRSIASTEFLVVTPRLYPFDRDYIYSLFCSASFAQVFASHTTGTSGSHQRVRPSDLLRIECVVPDPQSRERFSETVKPFFDKVAANIAETLTLANLRDALLPKLLSGEIRVKQAEKIVGEVA